MTLATIRRFGIPVVFLAGLSLAGCGSSSGSGGGGGATDTGGGSDAAGSDAVGGDTSATDTSAADTATTDTAAADTGGDTGGDAEPVCTYPDEGVCDGTKVSWCSDDGPQTYDCADDSDEFAVTCGKVSDSWGYDCLVPTGEDCTFLDADDELSWSFCAGGAGAACAYGKDIEPGCITGAPTCSDTDIGTCKDGFAILDCSGEQAWVLDCKAMGATCKVGDDGPSCTDVPKDGACDDESAFCATGLTCTIPTDELQGTCK